MKKIISSFEEIVGLKVSKEYFLELYEHAKYPMFNNLSDRARKYFFNLYVPSRGSLPLAVSDLFKYVRPKENLEDKLLLSDSVSKIVNNLNEKGYYVIKNYFNAAEVEKIKNELDNFSYVSASNNNISEKLLIIKKNRKFDTIANFYTKLNDKKILNRDFLFKVLENKYFQQIVNNYFGFKGYLNHVVAFYTNPVNIKKFTKKDLHSSAQLYHYDYSNLRFLKFFIYLSDITEPDNGAHTFISGSHEKGIIYPSNQENFLNSSLRVFSDGSKGGMIVKEDWINNNVDQNKIISMCYPKGTLIIENTTGLHKGNNCIKGKREMLSLVYSISNVCPINPKNSMSIESSDERAIDDTLTYLLTNYRKKHNEIYNNANRLKHRIINKFKSFF